jgi:hypothetical protein
MSALSTLECGSWARRLAGASCDRSSHSPPREQNDTPNRWAACTPPLVSRSSCRLTGRRSPASAPPEPCCAGPPAGRAPTRVRSALPMATAGLVDTMRRSQTAFSRSGEASRGACTSIRKNARWNRKRRLQGALPNETFPFWHGSPERSRGYVPR